MASVRPSKVSIERQTQGPVNILCVLLVAQVVLILVPTLRCVPTEFFTQPLGGLVLTYALDPISIAILAFRVIVQIVGIVGSYDRNTTALKAVLAGTDILLLLLQTIRLIVAETGSCGVIFLWAGLAGSLRAILDGVSLYMARSLKAVIEAIHLLSSATVPAVAPAAGHMQQADAITSGQIQVLLSPVVSSVPLQHPQHTVEEPQKP